MVLVYIYRYTSKLALNRKQAIAIPISTPATFDSFYLCSITLNSILKRIKKLKIGLIHALFEHE